MVRSEWSWRHCLSWGLGGALLAGASPTVAQDAAPKESTAPVVVVAPCDTCTGCGAFDFKNVPPVWPTPRTGPFQNPPKGPGYYSALDELRGEWRENPPKYGYPSFALMQPGFFNADFRYLDDPKNTNHDFFDPLKRIHIGDHWLFSTGGQAWIRNMNEGNSRLTEENNTYTVNRVRAYGDLWYEDKFRLYTEFISADITGYELPPFPTDVNKADFLNLFMDVKLGDVEGKPVYVRVGRQEMLFGSQRLISTLDWANTRRTFQGVSAFRQGEDWDVTAFWVRPVIPEANKLDSWDEKQNFAGVWTTYRPEKGQALDFYYLYLDNENRIAQQGIVRAPFQAHTLGTRYVGDKNNVLWDGEIALQLGERGNESIVAGMATAGAGYHFDQLPMNPTFWLYYDYASGDSSPNSGNYNTFNQLYPFGHYYLGWADLVGRQNIQDLNAHLFLYPTNWMTLWFQAHHFWLAESEDALYNAAGNAYRRSPNGSAGRDVGTELDFTANFHLTKHADLMVGYSKLFGGSFLENTAGPNKAVDSDLLYLIFGYRW